MNLKELTNEQLIERLHKCFDECNELYDPYGDGGAYTEDYIIPIYLEMEDRGLLKFYKHYAGITYMGIDKDYYYEDRNYKKSLRLEDLIDYYGNDNDLYETLDEALENLNEVYAYSWGVVYGKDKLIKVGRYYKQYGRVWVL